MGDFTDAEERRVVSSRPRSRPQLAAPSAAAPAPGDVVPRRAQDYPQQQDVLVPNPAVETPSLRTPVGTTVHIKCTSCFRKSNLVLVDLPRALIKSYFKTGLEVFKRFRKSAT